MYPISGINIKDDKTIVGKLGNAAAVPVEYFQVLCKRNNGENRNTFGVLVVAVHYYPLPYIGKTHEGSNEIQIRAVF